MMARTIETMEVLLAHGANPDPMDKVSSLEKFSLFQFILMMLLIGWTHFVSYKMFSS